MGLHQNSERTSTPEMKVKTEINIRMSPAIQL